MLLLNEIEYTGMNATCRHCDVATNFKGRVRWRLLENGEHIVHYQNEFQCQDCGELTMDAMENPTDVDWLMTRCTCGGEFRRDKPIFCKHCKANKTELNVSEPV